MDSAGQVPCQPGYCYPGFCSDRLPHGCVVSSGSRDPAGVHGELTIKTEPSGWEDVVRDVCYRLGVLGLHGLAYGMVCLRIWVRLAREAAYGKFLGCSYPGCVLTLPL